MASFAAAAVFNPVMALAADSDDGLIAPPGAAFSGGNPAPPTPWFGIAVSPANKLLDCPATNLGNQWVLTYSRCSELDDPFDPGFSTIVRYNVGGEAGPNGLGPLLQAMAHPIPDAGGIYGTPMLAKVAGPASADVAPLDFTSAVRVGDEGVILTWSWWPLNYISQLPVRVISLVPDGILVRRKDGIQGCKRDDYGAPLVVNGKVVGIFDWDHAYENWCHVTPLSSLAPGIRQFIGNLPPMTSAE
jgi:hypothetical protein